MRKLIFNANKKNIILYTFTGVGIAYASPIRAETFFDKSMLHQANNSAVDLTPFTRHGYQPEGVYSVDIYVNDILVGNDRLRFKRTSDGELHAEFNRDILIKFGLKDDVLNVIDSKKKSLLSELIHGGNDKLNANEGRLDVMIPQSMMVLNKNKTTAEGRWDDGITAMLFDYSINKYKTYGENKSDDFYVNTNNGFNLNGWRLRNSIYFKRTMNAPDEFNLQAIYAIKGFRDIKSTLAIGDYATQGGIFDGVYFKGLYLYSDELMQPEERQGYAPVVRGVADSNALVTIRQNGYIIHEESVSPGPFEITGISNAITGKELDVTVTETNGKKTQFQQGFTTQPMMLRQGAIRYSTVIGEHDNNSYANSFFSQGTFGYGLPYELTVNGGFTLSGDYIASSFGVGKNLGWLGAVSVDVQKSQSNFFDQSKMAGDAHKARFSKMIENTSTAINASYNMYDLGFYNLSERYTPNQLYKQKNRLDFSITQPLNRFGSVYMTVGTSDFHNNSDKNISVNGGYSWGYDDIIFSANYNYDVGLLKDRRVFFDVRVPLNYFPSKLWTSYSLLQSSSGRSIYASNISGSLLEDNALSYSIGKSIGDYESERLSIGYLSSNSNSIVEYSHIGNSTQLSYNLQGGLIAHQDGVTLSRSLGDTVALVRAFGVNNVKIQHNDGLATDDRGFAVIPRVNNYKDNYVSFDPRKLRNNVELVSSEQRVTPTQGAVVLADFKSKIGFKVLMKIHYDHDYPPFGAMASINGVNAGIVGGNGEVYLTGVPEMGDVIIEWGGGECRASYILPRRKTNDIDVYLMDAICT